MYVKMSAPLEILFLENFLAECHNRGLGHGRMGAVLNSTMNAKKRPRSARRSNEIRRNEKLKR